MAISAPVLLILGAGSNVGAGVARAFAAKGYKVATTSRSPQAQGKHEGDLHIQADVSDTSAVIGVFEKVTIALGSPSVVVHNAPASPHNPADDPLALSVADLNDSLQVNTASALVAAQQAQKSFASLPTTASRTFIYTGNILNITPMTPFLGLGMGKSATAHLIALASRAYQAKGYKFYYADERKADGSAAYQISGDAHGEFFVQLAEGSKQGPWLATFVKGKGYVEFPQ